MEKTAKKQPGFIFSDHFCFLTSQLLRRAAGPHIFGRFLWAVRKRREGILSGKAGLRRIKKTCPQNRGQVHRRFAAP